MRATSRRGGVALLSFCGLFACVLDNPLFGDGASASEGGGSAGSASANVSVSATGAATSGASATGTSATGTSATGSDGATSTGGASETSEGSTGGSTSAGTTGDPPPLGLCGRPFEALAFSAIAPVVAINGPDFEGDPSLTADGLTLFYSRNVPNYEIRYARRPTPDDAFIDLGDAQPVLGLNTEADDTKVSLTADGLRVYFGSSREGGLGGIDVWYGERASVDEPFGGLVDLATVSTSVADHDPQISSDELELFLAPYVEGVQTIVVATRPSAELDFAAPTVIDALASGAGEANPAISRDGRVIVFASGRSGGGDLYVAAREAPGAPFSPPVPIDALNDPGHYEGEPFIAEGDFGCEIYFVSDRAGAGAWDIWRAKVDPL